jgi:hypothetical protein
MDELKDICEYQEDEYMNVRKKFQETKDLAKESISMLLAFLKGFYEKLAAIGSRVGILAPYEDHYKAADVGQLVRPVIDLELAGNAQGFFSRNADRYKETLMGYYGQYTGKFLATALAFSATYASFGAELIAQDEMDQDKVLDYLKSVNSLEEYFGTIDFDKGEYGYPIDSPVPRDVRKTVAEDIKAHAGAAGYELEVELKKWQGMATPQQALVLETIRFLGLAFQQTILNLPGELYAINKRLTAITEGAVQFIKDGSKCVTKVAVLGDYADWYEVLSAKDLCTGAEITPAGRVISAVGIVGLSGKFWRTMGEAAGIAVSTKRVFKDIEAVVDSAKDVAGVRWGTWSDLSKVTVEGKEYAKIGTRRYTQHAIDRMTPTGLGTAAGGVAGRGVPTIVVEATIKNGEKVATEVLNGVTRETWKMGTVQVITENSGELVITVMRVGG